MATRPRESVLNLFDPLMAEPSPDDEPLSSDELLDADKENSAPPMGDLSLGALFGSKDQPAAVARPTKRLIDVGDSTIINTVLLEEDEDDSDEDDENETSMLGSDCATPRQSMHNLPTSPIHRSPLMEISLAEVTPGGHRRIASFTFPNAARPSSPTPSPSMNKKTPAKEQSPSSEHPVYPFGVPSVSLPNDESSPEEEEDKTEDNSEPAIPSAATHTFGVPLASLAPPSQPYSPNKSFGQSFYMGSRQSADFSFDLLNDNISFDPSKWHVDSIDFEGEAPEQEKSVEEHASVFTAPVSNKDAQKPVLETPLAVAEPTEKETVDSDESVKPSEIALDDSPETPEEDIVASPSTPELSDPDENREPVAEVLPAHEIGDTKENTPVVEDTEETPSTKPDPVPATPAQTDAAIQPPQAPSKPSQMPAPVPVQALRIVKRAKRVEANQLGSHLPSLPKADTRRASLAPQTRKPTPPKSQPPPIASTSQAPVVRTEVKPPASRMAPPSKPQLVQPRATRAVSARTQPAPPILQGAATKRAPEASKLPSGLVGSRIASSSTSRPRPKETSALPAPVKRIPSAMPRPATNLRTPSEPAGIGRPQPKLQQSAPSRLQAPASRAVSSSAAIPKAKPATSGINIPPIQGRLGRLPPAGRPRPAAQ